jgi:hypothetical protein
MRARRRFDRRAILPIPQRETVMFWKGTPLTDANAKAYAETLTGGKATYVRKFHNVDGFGDMLSVRVRLPSYDVAWVDCWIESGCLYGEY